MDKGVLEQLIGELLMTKDMLVVIDSGGAVAEMHPSGPMEARFEDGWAMVESEGWHVHVNMATVDGAQFVEAEDSYHDFPKLYYVRLSDAPGNTIIRFYFPNPWLDENEKRAEFQPEKLRVFEGFRDRYVGRGGVVFVRRPLSDARESGCQARA